MVEGSPFHFILVQLTYDENADNNLGPFTVDARLTSVGGSVLYATGDGRVSCFESYSSAWWF